MSKWNLKLTKRTDPYRYMIILMDDEGNFLPCGHGRYYTKAEAVARARGIAGNGQRCDVVVDVAASFGTGEE
jgi:hypothetical protein